MKKVLLAAALILALLLAGCSAGNVQQAPAGGAPSAPVSSQDGQGADVVPIPDITGSWYDVASKRAGLDVTGVDDGKYTFVVHWSSSAAEYTEWECTGVYNEATGGYDYTDGAKREVVYQDENSDPDVTVLYSDSTGTFALAGDRIVWSDAKDPETAAGRVFILNYDDVPADLGMLGFYMTEDGSTLELEYSDGIAVDMSIVRLAQFDGKAVYSAEDNALIADVTDPNGEPMSLKIVRNADNTVTVTVAGSAWDLLPEGESFVFE